MRILLAIFISVSFVMCKSEKWDLKISPDQAQSLLTDIHVAQEIIKKYPAHQQDSIRAMLRDQIAELHKMSIEEIDYNVEAMQRFPEEYFIIEENINKHFRALKDSIAK